MTMKENKRLLEEKRITETQVSVAGGYARNKTICIATQPTCVFEQILTPEP